MRRLQAVISGSCIARLGAVALSVALLEGAGAQCRTDELPSPAEADVGFGASVDVAASGDLAIVSELYLSEAHIYGFDGVGWELENTIDPPNDFTGLVAIDGDIAALVSDGSAVVWIYSYDGLDWCYETELVPESPGLVGSGTAIDVSGDTVVLGASLAEGTGPATGAAFVFRHDGALWSQEARLFASDGTLLGRFGESLAIDGDRVVVGATGEDKVSGNGAVYVFARTGDIWSRSVRLDPSEYVENFGQYVDLEGDLIVACAPADTSSARAAYIFRSTESGSWTEEARFFYDDYLPQDVAAGDDTVIVGLPRFNDLNGEVRYYRYDGAAWNETDVIRPSPTTPDIEFGSELSIGGDTAFIRVKDANRVSVHLGMATGDCNGNGAADSCDLFFGVSEDTEGDGVPDECGEDLVFFIGPDGGGWHEPAHWSSGSIPGPRDGVRLLKRAVIDRDATAAQVTVGSGGVATFAGGTLASAVVEALPGGAVEGDGMIAGFVVNGGLLSPGAPIGTFTIDGDYRQLAGGRLLVELAPGASVIEHDRLAVDGNATFGGTLEVRDTGGAEPASGDTFDVVTYESGGPGFSAVRPPELPDGTRLSGVYLGDRVQLEVTDISSAAPCRQLRREDAPAESCALDGDTAVVGATVLRRVGDAWLPEFEIPIEMIEVVDVDGDVLIATVPAENDAAGVVHIYRRSGAQWTFEDTLVASDAAPGRQFGLAAAVSGDAIMVGAPVAAFDPDEFAPPGKVYFFRFDGEAWIEEACFTAASPREDDNFGISLDLEGELAIAGLLHDDNFYGPLYTPGAAHVFRYDGKAWALDQVIDDPIADPMQQRIFGADVAIDGSVAAVCGFRSDFTGPIERFIFAHAYRHDGATWVEETVVEARKDNLFVWIPMGWLDVEGNVLALGSYDEIFEFVGNGCGHTGGEGQCAAGTTHLYRYDGWSWAEEPERLGPELDEIRFGWRLELSDDRLLAITAFGQAYFFEGVQGNDCDFNGIADSCDIASGDLVDFNGNGVPDICEPDCNGNGLPDYIDIAFGLSDDLNENGIPDECTCAADCGIPANEMVDTVDLLLLIGLWGQTTDECDLTGDGVVDTADLLEMLGAWGVCTP